MRQLSKMDVQTFAAVVDTGSNVKDVHFVKNLSSFCLCVGSEADGISDEVRMSCMHQITIPMDADVDSLSITVATGILLDALASRQTIPRPAHVTPVAVAVGAALMAGLLLMRRNR